MQPGLFDHQPQEPQPCEGCSNPDGGLYIAHCLDCCAREIANGPEFFDAMRQNRITERYRAALEYTFLDWRDGHRRVREQAKRITMGSGA